MNAAPPSAALAVVLLSGGLDSMVTAGLAREAGLRLLALTVDYNQRHRIELRAAARIAAHLGAERRGDFYTVASARMRELRNSLTPFHDNYAFTRTPIALGSMTVTVDCAQIRERRERRDCERAQRTARR